MKERREDRKLWKEREEDYGRQLWKEEKKDVKDIDLQVHTSEYMIRMPAFLIIAQKWVGKFGGELNLAVWQLADCATIINSAKLIYLH